MLNIRVSNSVTVTSDGLGFSFTHNKPHRTANCSLASLSQLAKSLIVKGLILPDQAQDGQSASDLCQQVAETFNIAQLRPTGLQIVFGGGAFIVTASPAGDWTLSNPTGTARRLSGGEHVGYIPHLAAAFELAVDRTFKASDQTIDYADVDAAYLALAQSLLSDVSLAGQSHQLQAAA